MVSAVKLALVVPAIVVGTLTMAAATLLPWTWTEVAVWDDEGEVGAGVAYNYGLWKSEAELVTVFGGEVEAERESVGWHEEPLRNLDGRDLVLKSRPILIGGFGACALGGLLPIVLLSIRRAATLMLAVGGLGLLAVLVGAGMFAVGTFQVGTDLVNGFHEGIADGIRTETHPFRPYGGSLVLLLGFAACSFAYGTVVDAYGQSSSARAPKGASSTPVPRHENRSTQGIPVAAPSPAAPAPVVKHRRLRCPRCQARVTVPVGVRPSCMGCGFA